MKTIIIDKALWALYKAGRDEIAESSETNYEYNERMKELIRSLRI